MKKKTQKNQDIITKKKPRSQKCWSSPLQNIWASRKQHKGRSCLTERQSDLYPTPNADLSSFQPTFVMFALAMCKFRSPSLCVCACLSRWSFNKNRVLFRENRVCSWKNFHWFVSVICVSKICNFGWRFCFKIFEFFLCIVSSIEIPEIVSRIVSL